MRIKLENAPKDGYYGFVGNYYFLGENKITQYSSNMFYEGEIITDDTFIGIVNNGYGYFAIKKDDNNYIYVMNRNFEVVEKIELKYKIRGIKGIAFNPVVCKILILNERNIYSFTVEGDFIKKELNCNYLKPALKLGGVHYLCGKTFIAYHTNKSAYIGILTKCGNIVEPFYIADDINIKCLGSICNEINLLADDYMYLIEKNEY